VRQRLDQRGVHRQKGVEQVGEADAQRLGNQAEQFAVGVEGPGAAGGGDLERWLAVAEEQLAAQPALGIAVDQLEGGGAVPGHVDHGDEPVGQHAPHRGAAPELFQPGQSNSSFNRPAALLASLAGQGGGEPPGKHRLPP